MKAPWKLGGWEWLKGVGRATLCSLAGLPIAGTIVAVYGPRAAFTAAFSLAVVEMLMGLAAWATLPVLSGWAAMRLDYRAYRAVDSLYYSLLIPSSGLLALGAVYSDALLPVFPVAMAVPAFIAWRRYRTSTGARVEKSVRKLYAHLPKELDSVLREVELQRVKRLESVSAPARLGPDLRKPLPTPREHFRNELDALRIATEALSPCALSPLCDDLQLLAESIDRGVVKEPRHEEWLHRLTNFYLPTARRLIGHYQQTQQLPSDDPKRQPTLEQIQGALQLMTNEFRQVQGKLESAELAGLEVELRLLDDELRNRQPTPR